MINKRKRNKKKSNLEILNRVIKRYMNVKYSESRGI